MPRPKGGGKGPNSPITIRLPPDEDAFYRRKANEAGLSLNLFITKLLVEGFVSGKVQDFADAMDARIAKIQEVGASASPGVSDDLMLSIITSEALLAEIVSKQDPQVLYRAQEAAKAKVRKIIGGRK